MSTPDAIGVGSGDEDGDGLLTCDRDLVTRAIQQNGENGTM